MARRIVILLLVLGSASIGTVAHADLALLRSSDARSCGDAEEAISSQRNDPFFTVEHPPTGSFTLSTGQVVPIPFPVYQADASIVYGLVDASMVRRLMAGSGHVPVLTRGRAIARLFIWELDTAVGPYEELAISFDSSTEEIAVPWVNAYSTFVPTLDPRATYFMHRLILDRWPSIHFGREFLGFDKIFGCIDIERSGDPLLGTTRTFAFHDTQGRAVLDGHINEPDIAVSTALAPHRLAEALGLSTPVDLPALSPEVIVGGVSPDILDGGRTWKYHTSTVRLSGIVTEFDGDLDISAASPMGAELRELGFEPMVVYRDPNVMFVMDLAEDGTPLIP